MRPTFRMLNAMRWPLPISPSRFSAGTFTSSNDSAQVDEPRMPSLCSSGPTTRPGDVAVDDEGGELVAADLREHREDVGEAGVGDELLRAVQEVVAAVVREVRPRLRGERVGPGATAR